MRMARASSRKRGMTDGSGWMRTDRVKDKAGAGEWKECGLCGRAALARRKIATKALQAAGGGDRIQTVHSLGSPQGVVAPTPPISPTSTPCFRRRPERERLTDLCVRSRAMPFGLGVTEVIV